MSEEITVSSFERQPDEAGKNGEGNVTVERPTGAGPLLAQSLDANSDRPGLRVGDRSYSYGALLARTAFYQNLAGTMGLSPSDYVLYQGEPSLDFYAVLLASVLGSFTASFLGHIPVLSSLADLVEALDPAIVWTSYPESAGGGQRRWISAEDPRIPSGFSLEPVVRDSGCAYLSLTSGTIGPPKCVLVDSVGMREFLTWARTELDLTNEDRWFEGGDPTSDLALVNALLAFSHGACFCVSTSRDRLRPLATANAYGATSARMVPALARLLKADAARRSLSLPSLRLLAFGGDALPRGLPVSLLESWGATPRTLNTYGKTEVAGFSIFNWFDPGAVAAEAGGPYVALGQPVPGTTVDVDVRGSSQDDTGELVLTSRAVAIRAFSSLSPGTVEFEKSNAGDRTTLHTGDLVRSTAEGLQFVGRMDREVKINGVRVSLEHIETLIHQALSLPACVVHEGGTAHRSRRIGNSVLGRPTRKCPWS